MSLLFEMEDKSKTANMNENTLKDPLLDDFPVLDDQPVLDAEKPYKQSQNIESSSELRKMGPCETFFAIAKSYCAVGILLLPKSFVNGGFVLSPLALFTACFFESMCAARLTSVAH